MCAFGLMLTVYVRFRPTLPHQVPKFVAESWRSAPADATAGILKEVDGKVKWCLLCCFVWRSRGAQTTHYHDSCRSITCSSIELWHLSK